MKPTRSLKARALQWLAQREQSRVELRRKLLPYALVEAADAGAARATVEALLDWLEAHQYLSGERFVESRVNARSARFGNLRIRSELKQHALALSPEAAQVLADTELDRATQLWERKFGAPSTAPRAVTAPATPAVRARQARFLAGRGFSPDTIRSVLRRTRSTATDGAD